MGHESVFGGGKSFGGGRSGPDWTADTAVITRNSLHAAAYTRQLARGNLHAAACTQQLEQSGTALLPGMSGLQRHCDVNSGSEVEQVRRLPAQRRAEREARPHPPEPGLHGRVEEVD